METPISVLHVDDDSAFTNLSATYLERADERIDVVTETRVEDAITVLDDPDLSIDCIVSDYDMPGPNGLEFLEAVRRREEALPFILFTGKGSEEIASEAIAAGVTDYLQKSGTEQYPVLANRIVNAVEQYRSVRTVERTERRLQELANKSNDVLWIYDGEWKEVLFINDAVEPLTGISPEQLEAEPRRFLEGTHPEDRDRVQRAMNRVAEGEPVDVEYRVNEREDYGLWAWAQAKPVFDESGAVDRIVGFVRDITERKRRERALAAINDVAVDLDALESVEGISERTIEASQKILDFDMSVIDIEEDGTLSKAALSADISPIDTATMSVEEGIAGKTYRSGESMIVDDVDDYPEANPQGPFRSAISIPIGTYGVFQAAAEEIRAFDETDLELAELLVNHTTSAFDRIARERQLRHQNERLEEFSRIVSHDLRNPLNVLDGYLELADEDTDSEHVADARAVIDRMEAIVEDTLTLATAGRIVDEMATVDLEPIATSCWQNVASESASLEVTAEATIRADPGRLRHVLENLYGNAVEHGGSDVTIRVGTFAGGFFVEDDGSGIPDDRRDSIFEPGNGGPGMGLMIVRQVVEAHGWSVRVAEAETGGARFEISDVEILDGDSACQTPEEA